MPQALELGQAPGTQFRSPCTLQGFKHLSHYLLPLRVHICRKLDWRTEPEFNTGTPINILSRDFR